MRLRVLCCTLLILAGCGANESATPAPSSTAEVLAAFEGEVDALTGIVSVRVVSDPPGGTGRAALVNLPEGSGVDTVSLSFAGGGVVSGGCNPGDAFQANATINSHYASNMLVNVYVEITSMSLTGREGCNSVAQYPAGLSSQFGLWKYGAIAPGASTAQVWKFHNPNNTSYRFSGVIKGTVLAPIATTPYATGSNPVSSVFDGVRIWVASQAASSGQSSTLRSVNAASGVIGTAVNVLAYPTVIQDVVTAETNSVLWVASANGAPGGSGSLRRYTASNASYTGVSFTSTPFNPVALAVRSNRDFVFAADQANDRVRFVRSGSGAERSQSPVTVPSSPVAIASDGASSIWVASSGPVAGGLNLSVISNTYSSVSHAGGTTPVAIAADDSASGFMWVADQGSYTVRKHAKASPGTFTVTSVEGRPDKLAYDSGTGSVWMLSIPDQVLTRIRASDGVVLGQYAVDFVPACLRYAATTPATLWICDGTGGGIRKWTVP